MTFASTALAEIKDAGEFNLFVGSLHGMRYFSVALTALFVYDYLLTLDQEVCFAFCESRTS